MSVDERHVAAEDVSFLSFVMFHFVPPPLFFFYSPPAALSVLGVSFFSGKRSLFSSLAL